MKEPPGSASLVRCRFLELLLLEAAAFSTNSVGLVKVLIMYLVILSSLLATTTNRLMEGPERKVAKKGKIPHANRAYRDSRLHEYDRLGCCASKTFNNTVTHRTSTSGCMQLKPRSEVCAGGVGPLYWFADFLKTSLTITCHVTKVGYVGYQTSEQVIKRVYGWTGE